MTDASQNDPGKPLAGRVALVTGASRGIGAAVARQLARAGAQVVLTARTTGGLEEVDDQIRQEGGTATLAPLNLTQHDQIDVLGASLFQRFGKLDILVGNAAILGSLSPMAHADPKKWRQVFDLNVHANHRLIRSFDALLRQSDAGRAVFVTCAAANAEKPFWAAYGASKAALNAMVKMYAGETAKTPLRVNLIDPGPVATRLRAQAYPGEEASDLRQPDDVAAAFVELCLPACTRHGEIVTV